MVVLVYGFGPYKRYKTNITQRLVKALPRSARLRKIVFPVRFERRRFIAALRKHRPDVVLGLGQCAAGKRLRIERRAANRKRNDEKERARPINRRGPRTLAPTLRLERKLFGRGAKFSRNAGDYVCNFSMYVILDYLRRRSPATRFGFIHVPRRFRLVRARRLLGAALRAVAPA